MDNFSIYNSYFIGCSLDYAKWQNVKSLITQVSEYEKIYFSAEKRSIFIPIEQNESKRTKYYGRVLSLSFDMKHFIIYNNYYLIACIFTSSNLGIRMKIKEELREIQNFTYFKND